MVLLVFFPVESPAATLIHRSAAEGGHAMSVCVEGPRAYVGFANVLSVRDVSNPETPFESADCLLGGDARCIVFAAGYLYVAASGGGLEIMDVSAPANPTKVGAYHTPGNAVAVSLSGNYAFVADETGGLRVIDVVDTANPVEIGSETTSVTVTGVTVQGNYAYLSGDIALVIVDVSTPSSPTVVGSYDLTGNTAAVAVDGDYAFVVHTSHLLSFDVQDRVNPQYLDAGLVDGGRGVVLDGGHAFVPSQSGMRIFDVTDPGQVAYTGTAGGRHGYDVDIVGNLAYVAYGIGGFDIRDIADATTPLTVFDGDEGWKQGVAVAVVGDNAYVAAEENLLKVVDVSNPSDVVEIGNMTFVPSHLPLSVTAVASTGDYAYVAQAPFGFAGVDIEIVNVADPTNPVHAATYNDANNLVGVTAMQVVGDLLYTVKDGFGLRIYDVSTPLAPFPAANYNSGSATACAVDGQVTYLALNAGVFVLDTSASPTITKIGEYITPGSAASLALDPVDDRLYVADDGSGLLVLDVSTPSTPVKLGDVTSFTTARDVAVSGGFAYVAGTNEIHIIDVSDPSAPVEAGAFDKTSGGALRVLTRGNDVFVLERNAGLYSLANNGIATAARKPVIRHRAVLEQNTPNPFNPRTVIRYWIESSGPVRLNVYDVRGRLVRTLVDAEQNGRTVPYSVVWDGRDNAGEAVASGVYFYQLVAPGFVETRKMILLK
jgi:hypothetical protein